MQYYEMLKYDFKCLDTVRKSKALFVTRNHAQVQTLYNLCSQVLWFGFCCDIRGRYKVVIGGHNSRVEREKGLNASLLIYT